MPLPPAYNLRYTMFGFSRALVNELRWVKGSNPETFDLPEEKITELVNSIAARLHRKPTSAAGFETRFSMQISWYLDGLNGHAEAEEVVKDADMRGQSIDCDSLVTSRSFAKYFAVAIHHWWIGSKVLRGAPKASSKTLQMLLEQQEQFLEEHKNVRRL